VIASLEAVLARGLAVAGFQALTGTGREKGAQHSAADGPDQGDGGVRGSTPGGNDPVGGGPEQDGEADPLC
jgi:hypothetical protein